MEYKEQLQSIEWENKRKEILKRDNNRCIKCSNKSFENNFKRGLLINKDFDPRQAPPYKRDNDYLCKVWTFDEPMVLNTFINFSNYSDQENYICYYYENLTRPDLANVVAMQKIGSDEIEMDKNFHKNLRERKLNPKFTENTKQKILAPIQEDSNWEIISNLHIHHTYYQVGLKAWEYPDNSLQTLCWECHENLHKNTLVPKYDLNGNEIGKLKTCLRCHGAGIFPEFSHVYFGICFRCDGYKYERN